MYSDDESKENNSLIRHYASYKESLLRDLLPGCDDYARRIDNPLGLTIYPTHHDYLENLGLDIYSAVEDSSIEMYLGAITRHKRALVWLLESMVHSKLGDTPSVEAILQSWELFRFSRSKGALIKFKEGLEIHVIPYYGEFCKDLWDSKDMVFDVDEVLLLEGMDWEMQKNFLLKKTGLKQTKLMSRDGDPTSLKEVNTPYNVGDWKLIGCPL